MNVYKNVEIGYLFCGVFLLICKKVYLVCVVLFGGFVI